MRWYEYKMEVDELHAPEDLKARLLAMQAGAAPQAPAARPARASHTLRPSLAPDPGPPMTASSSPPTRAPPPRSITVSSGWYLRLAFL